MKKRASKTPPFRMRLDVWDKDVVLTFDHESYVAVVNSHDPGATSIERTANTVGMCLYIEGTKKPIVIGWFNGKLDTLVHECVHAAVATLDDKGVPLTLENDEALAYTVDCLFATLSKVKRARR